MHAESAVHYNVAILTSAAGENQEPECTWLNAPGACGAGWGDVNVPVAGWGDMNVPVAGWGDLSEPFPAATSAPEASSSSAFSST